MLGTSRLSTLAVCTLALARATGAAAQANAPPRISAVELYEPLHASRWTLRGSLAGGTRLAISGDNFLAPDGTFDETLVVTVGGRVTPVIHFLSSGARLVLDTPPLPPEAEPCCHKLAVRLRRDACAAREHVDEASVLNGKELKPR